MRGGVAAAVRGGVARRSVVAAAGGIGIDAGEAVAVEGGYRGGALNLAARLCSLAKAGQVLVSEGAVLMARKVDEVAYVSMGRVQLKGLREPVRYFAAQFELDLPEAEAEQRVDAVAEWREDPASKAR
jgi:class 3 adenylate cyclase